MSKSSIFIIIVLMSVALLGLSGIQVYWIKKAIDLNETNFDYSVYQAIKRTSERLQKAEENILPYESFPGYQSFEMDLISKWFNGTPLYERIVPYELDTILKQELDNQGITIEYNYGIYSFSDGDIIIENGHYSYFDDDEKPLGTLTPFNKSLLDSKYKVQLFGNDPEPPGLLMIQFPQITSAIFKSVMEIIILSIIFTLVVLICFSYTIYVIFRQKKLSRLKNDFINNMTHELKTPIATISLATDSMYNPTINENPDKIKRFASIIKQENERMLNQVEKVLQMALIDTNQLNLSLTEIHLNEMIESAVENNRLRVEQKGGKIHFIREIDNDLVKVDRIHVANVLYNLIDNAIKYSPDEPIITVRSSQKDKYMVISVSDKGKGMTKEDAKYIFDRFYRVQSGNLHDVKGFGLGLSYVNEIVHAHKGRIEVESELNQGSTFHIFLPLHIEK